MRQSALEFLGALQRPQPARPRQQQVPRQAREQEPAQQLVPAQVHPHLQELRRLPQQGPQWERLRLAGRRIRTPQQDEVHMRPRLGGHVKLQALAAEQQNVHRRKGPEEQRAGRKRPRQVVERRPSAAKPERDLKVRELRQRRALLVKRQLSHRIASEEENAKPLRHRRDNNQSRLDREF